MKIKDAVTQLTCMLHELAVKSQSDPMQNLLKQTTKRIFTFL